MKMRRDHRVPLAPQTLALLKSLKEFTGNYQYILPGANDPDRPLSENTLNHALRKLGFRHDVMTAHGFRSSASTMLNESGLWNRDAIEAQLAHVDPNPVRRAYARAEYWEERVRMMAWWGNKLDALRLTSC
jgi:integrase